ncbi:acyl-CoA dehydrogenase [Mesorhizobium australicum]|uniref:Acyl-CoA dehydrogenase n=1 Tax=Mesorhizobium australicum TaxID=536018 RepID=A0A1X7MTM2_9HYPH|nr:acyl-CoA dehydrogenase [Mesorhizobium australicum]SMH27681.1 acyl-CoA dehydrogenase [Mesorhizobium australicum]
METDDIALASARRLFGDLADIQTILAAADDSWKERLWAGIEETGLNIAALPEERGGAGFGIGQSLALLRIAGNMALSAPLAETVLAGWMLGAAGLDMPAGRIAFAPASFCDEIALAPDGTLTGRIARLPFAGECAHAAMLAKGPAEGQVEGQAGLHVALVALDGAEVEMRQNLAYEAIGRVAFVATPVLAHAPAPRGFTAQTALLMGAAARSMQIAGALERMLLITAGYVTERRAFERTISKFQAVQHSVAQLAGEAAVALSAAASAAEALESLLGEGRGFDDAELVLEIASAKIRAASAARKGAAIAHQLHGAIGVTSEHILHRLTLRALAWRDDYGNESEWSLLLGQLVCRRGAGELWPLLASR